MSRRDQIRMTEDEIRLFLDEQRVLQVASINQDGTPHLVAMWYCLADTDTDTDTGPDVTFWTYAKSQKIKNLRRDPRLTCLVEAGQRYEELRGVSITGTAELSGDRDEIQRVGEALFVRYNEGPLDDAAREGVSYAGAKRVVVTVKPDKVISWDHRKLGGVY